MAVYFRNIYIAQTDYKWFAIPVMIRKWTSFFLFLGQVFSYTGAICTQTLQGKFSLLRYLPYSFECKILFL